MSRIEALRSAIAEKSDRHNSLRASLQEYITRDGEPTDEERAKFEADTAEFAGIDPEVERMSAELTKLEAIANAPERSVERPGPTVLVRKGNPLDDESVQYGPTEQVRGAARTAIEKLPLTQDHVRDNLYRSLERADDAKGTLARHMIAASRPAYRSAFSKLISGDNWSLTTDEIRSIEHVRAASLTDASGGYAVPTVLDPTLITTGTHDGLTPNAIRQLANVRQITGDNLTVVRSDGVTASWVAENTEATDGAPTLDTLTLTPYKAHTFVPFTVEIQGDWAAMESEMRRMMMVAKDDLEMTAFVTGTGSTQPLGLFYDVYTNYTGQVQASSTSNDFVVADVYALIQKVAFRFRGRGSFLANEITFDEIRGFGTEVKNIWGESLEVDRPATILRRPVYGNPAIDATYGSGENYVMAFGDIREAYTIVDRVGMSVELIPHIFGTGNNFPKGMRGLYAWWRTGARVVNEDAIAVLNIT